LPTRIYSNPLSFGFGVQRFPDDLGLTRLFQFRQKNFPPMLQPRPFSGFIRRQLQAFPLPLITMDRARNSRHKFPRFIGRKRENR